MTHKKETNSILFLMSFLYLSCGIALFLSIFVLFIYFPKTPSSYTLTKAVCEGTACRDYEITCTNEGEIMSQVPLTGLVTFPSDWKDTREIRSLCAP